MYCSWFDTYKFNSLVRYSDERMSYIGHISASMMLPLCDADVNWLYICPYAGIKTIESENEAALKTNLTSAQKRIEHLTEVSEQTFL